MQRALVIVLALALAVPAIGAQPSDDIHLNGGANHLYAASAFAHGLRHGYEEGFHDADRDLHLSAFAVGDLTFRKVPKMIGYDSSFGSKDSFRKGYEAGYRLGYADSIKGVSFRVNMPTVEVAAAPDREFDRGVQYGYTVRAERCSGSRPFCAGVQAGQALALTYEPGTQVASVK